MAGMSFLVDTSRCTACRGCQMACKSWNQNGASMTKNLGTHQNPPDLDGNTFKLVRFSEHMKGAKPVWYFFADQCRHCLEPPCKDAIEGYVDGAVIHDEDTGAVVYTEKTQGVPVDEVRAACPYDIPRAREDGTLVKCTMCIDRVKNGLKPACVQVCPTGAMNFGTRDEMMALAQERLAALKGKFPKAQLLDPDDVRTIYLVTDDPQMYHPYAVAGLRPGISRKLALRKLFWAPARHVAKGLRLG
ncbi:formate dehydrogenase iron-sulfur subunit [Desulfacinum hydrothermale DSM 13146]|uniref:Formate dehydrogenase iron-sulfur subunit n=1 Tax=Desulfacinum hydrothermale DSM 13146 TaxID=1121390 RepID=A0A1W1XCU0_9BACT|nr:4Fe-4S dicluster domain-containing protein [Desulfacinum hydrothermale]SMC21624.1 formate dehydrogenase iron-sulfur subunit [Desulfacinum hydrothermale DSM 13146]